MKLLFFVALSNAALADFLEGRDNLFKVPSSESLERRPGKRGPRIAISNVMVRYERYLGDLDHGVKMSYSHKMTVHCHKKCLCTMSSLQDSAEPLSQMDCIRTPQLKRLWQPYDSKGRCHIQFDATNIERMGEFDRNSDQRYHRFCTGVVPEVSPRRVSYVKYSDIKGPETYTKIVDPHDLHDDLREDLPKAPTIPKEHVLSKAPLIPKEHILPKAPLISKEPKIEALRESSTESAPTLTLFPRLAEKESETAKGPLQIDTSLRNSIQGVPCETYKYSPGDDELPCAVI